LIQKIFIIIKNKKKSIFLFLIVLTLLTLLGGFLRYNNSHSSNVVSGLPRVGTEKMTDIEIKKESKKKIDESSVSIQIYSKVLIESNGKTGVIRAQNVPSNKTGQKLILKEEKTGNTLYTSDLLKPGYQVSSLTLGKKLSKGVHKGNVTVIFYDLENKKQVGQTNVAVTIIVA
jgi:hypothetical protein